MRSVATISIWWQALQDRTFIQAGGVIARSCRVCCLLRLLAARIGPLCTTLPSGTTWYTCVPSTCSASNSAYDPVGTRQMRNSQHRVQPILVASASQVAFQSSVNSYGGSRPLIWPPQRPSMASYRHDPMMHPAQSCEGTGRA